MVKELVCDRLHLSFGQSQAVSAVHRELNCSDCVTLDHGFELHYHMPHSKVTSMKAFLFQRVENYLMRKGCAKAAMVCMQSTMIDNGLRANLSLHYVHANAFHSRADTVLQLIKLTHGKKIQEGEAVRLSLQEMLTS